MKGISILTGAVIALGLGSAPAAFADEGLEHVTLGVFDEVDDIAHISLEGEDLVRDARSEDETEGDGVSQDGAPEGEGEDFDDVALANIVDGEMGEDWHDDEEGEGDLDDLGVPEEGHEHESDLEGEGEMADGAELEEGVGADDVAVESVEDVMEDLEEDGDTV